MFSTNQMIFAGFFVIIFAAFLIWTYRKDIGLHKIHYKGSKWILVGFILFLLLIISIKFI